MQSLTDRAKITKSTEANFRVLSTISLIVILSL